MPEIIIGRRKEDLEKYGKECTGFIGRHIVGKGDEAHLTVKVLMDFLRPHLVMVVGKRGSGKCVEENTPVVLGDGRVVPIKELENDGTRSVLALNKDFKIEKTLRTKFYKRKVKTLLSIKLRSGREIKLTPDHLLLTISGWKEARTMKKGDRIATPRVINVFGKRKMKDHEIKLLAYLIAEGCLSSGFVLFTNKNPKIMEEFIQLVKKFDPELKVLPHGKYSVRVSKSKRKAMVKELVFGPKGFLHTNVPQAKSSIRIWLEKIGLYGKLSHQKFIPQQIFQLPKNQLSTFLNRLFSCDGSFYKKKTSHGFMWVVSYSSASKKLIHQIQHLLLRFGILSTIRTKKHKGKNYYELDILHENIVKFLREIGWFMKDEEYIKRVIQEIETQVRNPNVDTIPKEIWNFYRPKNWAYVGRKMGYSVPKGLRSSINYSPSRKKLQKIAEIDGREDIYKLATSDVFWDEIVDIQKLEGDFTVCDIEVPNHHNFVASDIIVHNSYSGAVIAEEIALLPEEYRKNLAVVMVDTMGIFWSMKYPNEEQMDMLHEWGLEPRGFKEQVKVFAPLSQKKEFEEVGIEVDYGISVEPWRFEAEDWALAFNLPRTNPQAIALEKVINRLKDRNEQFMIEDIITEIKDDKEIDTHVKDSLVSMLTVANNWGVFGTEGIPIEEMLKPGIISVFDVSHLRATEAWSVRNLLVAMLARDVYQKRVIARRLEELERMGEIQLKERYPMVWMIVDECLPYNTLVTTIEHETPIGRIVEDFKKGKDVYVMGYHNGSTGWFKVTNVFEKGMKDIVEIETETGKKVRCTPDHRVLSSVGFVSADVADSIAVPLSYPHKMVKKLVLARLLGHVFGDGWLEKNSRRVGFSGNPEDLRRISNDIRFLGYKPSKVSIRNTSSTTISQKGKVMKISGLTSQITAGSKLYEELKKLGAPVGEKVSQRFNVPSWLMKASEEEKAEFLASLMGSDGYAPSFIKSNPRCFHAIRLVFYKIEELKENGLEYARQLKKLFQDLGIKVSSIKVKKGNKRKDGKLTLRFELTISNENENLIRFLQKVGYRYSIKKEVEGKKVLEYLLAKRKVIMERKKLMREAITLYKKYRCFEKVAKILGVKPSAVSYWVKHSKGNVRIPNSFPTYVEWLKERELYPGVLFEKIVSIKKVGREKVFDITVETSHNFVANGMIVHNCHNFVGSEYVTASTEPFLTIVKQGRQPGISLVAMTQMPNKLHPEVIAQTDLVISHRLTAKSDLDALHAVMQNYMREDLWKYLNSLPPWRGAAIVLDDNSERIFPIKVRPRLSWHAGESAIVKL
ncbi:MAG: hypothetical protein J7K98_01770 [Candidatus Aenigmarchaeota archaeon]|nr:hypothetical protein [Candidatus Aenigmarchaeota archaeon]